MFGNNLIKFAVVLFLLPLGVALAQEEKELADMSDPLAVFAQIGAGFTNEGVNLKFGQVYDTGNENTAAQNLIELKGILGDSIGWGTSSGRTNSVSSVRFRNFGVDLRTGRGTQIDLSYDLDEEVGSANYSALISMPKLGSFQYFPLAGLGLAFANNAIEDDGSVDSGFSVPGTTAFIGMYGKYTLNSRIWINYNPNWFTTLSGAENFKESGVQGNESALLHEFIMSYKLNERSNVRIFFNWSSEVDFKDGDQRIEYNYQF